MFDLALKFAQKYQDKVWNEQPYLSLAMELLNFNPYTLSPSFNHRAFGELISGPIRIWDLATGKEVKSLSGHGNTVTGLVFAPDGKLLVSRSLDKTLRVWRLP